MLSTTTASEQRSTPALAAGVELLGAMHGSGYRRPPALVRRADGQVLQLTPTLYALLEVIDGRRDHHALAAALSPRIGAEATAEDVEFLLERKLRPLGVLRGADGTEPQAARANPLLALRCRYVVTDARTTNRLTGPFVGLFRPVVVAAVVAAFLAVSGWVVLDHGLAGPTRHVLYEPALLLTVFALTLCSAGFHELGHAAACRYGGARPTSMGVGLYLVFPAFYTDVSDSYRLPRRGRLRVDLGGIYFNAVFAVAAFGLWAATGWEALLVIVPLQQLQMLRQLLPLVRLDGYHILADLTGVPDLFARIRPTLLALLPTRWGRPENRVLRPATRLVVTTWVLLVVPILLATLVVMVVTLPRLVATVFDSVGLQWQDLSGRFTEGDIPRTVLGAIGVLALVVPLLSVSYFLTRIARRAGRGLWRATEDDPALRGATICGFGALLLVAVASWWPSGQYEPITTTERGTLAELVSGAGGDPVLTSIERPAAAPATRPVADVPAADPPLVVVTIDPSTIGLDAMPAFPFQLPDAPAAGDNQAVALNRTDGTVVNVSSGSLVWVFDGVVDHVNEAWALSNCRDCATQALAYQVVLVVGQAEVVGPQNIAVAANGNCASCVANAVARQLVLTLGAMPEDSTVRALEAVWERVEATLAGLGTVPIETTLAQLDALETELVGILEPVLVDIDRTETGTGSTSTTTATTVPSTSTSSSSTTTTATTATTATTTTIEPTTTTTTESPTTTEVTPTSDVPG